MKFTQVSKNAVLLGLMLSVLLLLPAFVRANEPPDGHSRKKFKEQWEQKEADIHKQLGVTPEQEAALNAHKEKYRAQINELKTKIKAKREEIANEVQKAEFDTARVRQIHEELKVLKAQMEDYHLEGVLEVRKILTLEQFNKFSELKKDWKKQKKEKHHSDMQMKMDE